MNDPEPTIPATTGPELSAEDTAPADGAPTEGTSADGASIDAASIDAPSPDAAPATVAGPLRDRLSPRARSAILLGLVLLLGATLRFTGLNWDAFTHNHPDERFLTDIAWQLEFTANPALYLRTSESPLNPYNLRRADGTPQVPLYVYGNFFMTATRAVAEIADAGCRLIGGCGYAFLSYDGIHLVGRFLSGLVDLLAVAVTFLIGRRLYNARVGLLAALLSAAAVMQIQQSHFFTADNWAASASVLAIYFAVRAADDGQQRRWWALFGIALGIAVANRINVAPLAGMAVVAATLWLSRQINGWAALLTRDGLAHALTAASGVAVAALSSMLTFRLAMPYAFADRAIVLAQTAGDPPGPIGMFLRRTVGLNPEWVADLAEIRNLQQPDAVFPPALQWIDRAAIAFPLANMVLWGMGLAAGLAACIGLVVAVQQIARSRPGWRAHVIPAVWVAGYFLFMGVRWVKSIRYFLPIYPLLLLFAAWALIAWWDATRDQPRRRALAGSVTAGVAAFTLVWAFSFVQIYRQPLTRVTASEWMAQNIPSGATLLYTVDGTTRQRQLPLRDHRFPAPLQLVIELPPTAEDARLRLNYVRSGTGAAADAVFTATLDGAAATVTPVEVGSAESAVTLPLPALPPADGADIPGRYFLELSAEADVPLIAATSTIMNEHWDDPLPFRLPNFDPYGGYYDSVTDPETDTFGLIPVTWTDSPAKLQGFLRWLDAADVIVLSSQRGIWSTARAPLTYPLTNTYYEALFDGSLGFELVAEFHAPWRIGPLRVSDTGGRLGWGDYPAIGWPDPPWYAAEEAFSVYDHPPVWIFQKTDAYDFGRVATLLGSVDLGQVQLLNPGQATAAPTGLLMPDVAFATVTTGSGFAEQFNPNNLLNRQPWLAAVAFWLVASLIGWLLFPLLFTALPGLPSRGFALTRTAGLLLVSYTVWLVAGAGWLPNRSGTYWLALLALAAVSAAVARPQRHALAAYWRRERRWLVTIELLAAGLFVLGLLLRLANPDLWDVIWGGEKPMDLSYFTAVLRSPQFPPYDPWYAGGVLNYYYYGFVFVGVLPQLLGVQPSIAYNVSIGVLFALTGLGAFGVAADLVRWRARGPHPRLYRRALGAGLMAVTLCLFLGNLGQLGTMTRAATLWGRQLAPQAGAVTQAVRGGAQLVASGVCQATRFARPEAACATAPIYTGDWFWTASRAIAVPPGEVQPITEFPFFTFLYGDLHAHMIALPLTLLALGWALAFGLQPVLEHPSRQAPRGQRPLQWALGVIAIGVLFPANSWDWPTYTVIGLLGIALYQFRRRGAIGFAFGAGTVLHSALLIGGSYLAFLPFRNHFGTAYESFAVWEGTKTGIGSYLTVYGLFLFLTLTFLAHATRAWLAGQSAERLARAERLIIPMAAIPIAVILLAIGLALNGMPVALIALPIVALAGLLSLQQTVPASQRAVLALIAAAYFLTLFVEQFIVQGTVGRMNTVFKFYMQVWVLLSVTLAAGLGWMWPSLRDGWDPWRRRAWLGVAALLVAVAALYPPTALHAKWLSRVDVDAPRTLDGMTFLQTATYNDSGQMIQLQPEYEALRWLQRNVTDTPVVAEAYAHNYYRAAGNRVAMYTGLPAVIGWGGHQNQQRAVLPDSGVAQRIADIEALYNAADSATAERIIARYGIELIYVGGLERAYYAASGLAKFDAMAADGALAKIYDSGAVQIYRVQDARQSRLPAVPGGGAAATAVVSRRAVTDCAQLTASTNLSSSAQPASRLDVEATTARVASNSCHSWSPHQQPSITAASLHGGSTRWAH